MKENIVEFPRNRIVREFAGSEFLEQVKEKSKQNFAESISDDLVTYLLTEMENIGIDTSTDKFLKDFSMTVDSLRAAVYRSFDVPHHLHDFIDKNVKMINRETGEPIDFLTDDEIIDTDQLDKDKE
jgi:transcriptional regulator NrdR family protein